LCERKFYTVYVPVFRKSCGGSGKAFGHAQWLFQLGKDVVCCVEIPAFFSTVNGFYIDSNPIAAFLEIKEDKGVFGKDERVE
jgi:hypothetical protein